MNMDLSDEALEKWIIEQPTYYRTSFARAAWIEARRRAEAMLEEAIKKTIEMCEVWNDREQQIEERRAKGLRVRLDEAGQRLLSDSHGLRV
jgi:hypothetical protein